MRNPRIHILYEYGADKRPHGSAHLRLLRPFTYPTIREKFMVTCSREINTVESGDVVIVDRLWNKEITPQTVLELSNAVHQQGANLMYWFDDNFLEVDKNISGLQKESFKAFLEQSDAIVVTTPVLASGFQDLGKPVYVIPNTLDDRLIIQKPLLEKRPGDKIVIGYMGTATHDDDLRMILPALEAVYEKYPDRVVFQIIGAVDELKLRRWEALNRLPITLPEMLPVEIEYPSFMLWFTGHVRWDIAVAPLADTKFNRFKSDIKFLDYAAAGFPGVYSRCEAYASTVEDHLTGLLVDNDPQSWVAALVELVENDRLRRSIAENARAYLFAKRVLSQCGNLWVDTLMNFVENHANARA